MNLKRDVQSLTEFNINTPEFVRKLIEYGEPIVLTIDGKAALVVQDAGCYQKLIDLAEESKAVGGIHKGLEDMRGGRTQPLAEAFEEIRRELDLPQGI